MTLAASAGFQERPMSDKHQTLPPQEQPRQPGLQTEMTPAPRSGESRYRAAGQLEGKSAIITGGDSGLGRAVAISYARKGCNLLVSYSDEHEAAVESQRLVEAEGRKCALLAGDIAEEAHCEGIVKKAVSELRKTDILVNNAAEQHVVKPLED